VKFTRRSLLALSAVVSGLTLAPQPAGAAAALPTVDMEAVLKAAQWDPAKADSAVTPGAGPSVKLVETALRQIGLLDQSYVDGHFGTKTVTAYAQWQQQLGYSGIDATGLPGRTSLTKLGEGQFTLTRVVSAGARTTYRGFPINDRTLAMLRAAQVRSGVTFVVEQGSYSPGTDPTSAGTHDGGGVVDIKVDGMTADTRTAVARALRQVGFAAWVRSPSQGDWPWHIHAVAINDTDQATQAQNQVGDYYLGFNGLANHRPDDGPRITIRTWEEYQRTR